MFLWQLYEKLFTDSSVSNCSSPGMRAGILQNAVNNGNHMSEIAAGIAKTMRTPDIVVILKVKFAAGIAETVRLTW